jgi:decaprenylphospho-beta-D-erythro-pentofuranosid-2-ulose 2-reductase
MTPPLPFIVIVGGTSTIAVHCARTWMRQRPARLLLLGRDQERLEGVAADLRIRSPLSRIDVLVGDLASATSITHMVGEATAQGTPDVVLIAQGVLPEQAACQQDLAQAEASLRINAISPVLFAEAWAGVLERAGHGTLGIIGSVAGDRGRRSNYVYGAAKGLVERYAEGLQHRMSKVGAVKVVLIKPGPTDTPMTAHMAPRPTALADPAAVAEAIVQGMRHGHSVVYAPAKWRWIMCAIRWLPRAVFHRLSI